MVRNPLLKKYIFGLTSRRGNFSVSFAAANDAGALAHVARWLERSGSADDGVVRIVGPDGREVTQADARPRDAQVPDSPEPGA